MTAQLIDEQQIQDEIDQLKTQFPQTRDLYREVCVLLFFRYGVTPTANRLYQYVRKGSMSAPAEALNKFWTELRDKSRIRIERPDLPEPLKDAVGAFAATFWQQAQGAAQADFTVQIADADENVSLARHEADQARQDSRKFECEMHATQADLKNALQRLAESEKNHAVDISALGALEKSFKSLQNETNKLDRALEEARSGFSDDLDKVNLALIKAEERYRALEVRALLEVDGERQRAIELERELAKLRRALSEQEKRHLKQLAGAQQENTVLREKLGVMSGQFKQLLLQQKETAKKLSATQRSLELCRAKLTRRS